MKHLAGYTRFDLTNLLGDRTDCVGIELGVAAGQFSAAMVKSGKFRQFWGVDMYADTHDTKQYCDALKAVGIDENYKLLRMTFDEAADLFPNQYFDFMYLDGYASSGLEGGGTLRKWASKVKIGGIIAGDDYHEECPLLQDVVDEFVEQNQLELMTTEGAFDFSAYGHYPSWAVYKKSEIVGETSVDLQKEGERIAEKFKAKKKRAKRLDDLLRRLIPETTHARLRDWNSKRKKKRRMRRSKSNTD
ncbi:MAG: class I SAM-dependent methyltransferase [Rhodobacteraceae bacterium]|nr:class I SAM-dependent methyltransferase [Paracoccaceae bacterium]